LSIVVFNCIRLLTPPKKRGGTIPQWVAVTGHTSVIILATDLHQVGVISISGCSRDRAGSGDPDDSSRSTPRKCHERIEQYLPGRNATAGSGR
jgi:hypothetical protein